MAILFSEEYSFQTMQDPEYGQAWAVQCLQHFCELAAVCLWPDFEEQLTSVLLLRFWLQTVTVDWYYNSTSMETWWLEDNTGKRGILLSSGILWSSLTSIWNFLRCKREVLQGCQPREQCMLFTYLLLMILDDEWSFLKFWALSYF